MRSNKPLYISSATILLLSISFLSIFYFISDEEDGIDHEAKRFRENNGLNYTEEYVVDIYNRPNGEIIKLFDDILVTKDEYKLLVSKTVKNTSLEGKLTANGLEHGGTYIDNRKMAISIVDLPNQLEIINKIFPVSDSYIFKNADFSKRELEEQKILLRLYISHTNNEQLLEGITSYGVSTQKNRVIITLRNINDDEARQLIEEVIDAKYIYYEEGY